MKTECEPDKKKPSDYEIQAMKEIHNFKNPSGWLEKVGKAVNLPFSKAGEVAMKIPGVDWVINKTFVGLISLLNDAAHWSVRTDSIFEEFRKFGHDIQNNSDLYQLDLREIDKTIGFLDAKYKVMAAIEGASTGFLGLPGIPPDILAIITYNLRAIGEYATYCGFDILLQQERLYAMNILGLASSATGAAKQAAMGQLAKIATDAAAKKTWEKLNDYMFVKIIQQITETLGACRLNGFS